MTKEEEGKQDYQAGGKMKILSVSGGLHVIDSGQGTKGVEATDLITILHQLDDGHVKTKVDQSWTNSLVSRTIGPNQQR